RGAPPHGAGRARGPGRARPVRPRLPRPRLPPGGTAGRGARGARPRGGPRRRRRGPQRAAVPPHRGRDRPPGGRGSGGGDGVRQPPRPGAGDRSARPRPPRPPRRRRRLGTHTPLRATRRTRPVARRRAAPVGLRGGTMPPREPARPPVAKAPGVAPPWTTGGLPPNEWS